MHKKFFITAAILMAVAAGLATTALWQRSGKRFGHHSGWMLNRMSKQLGLSEAQQTQIKSIMADGKTRMKPLIEQLRQNRQAESANSNGTFNENQARAFATKQTNIMADLMVEKQRTRSQIFAVLTPEQRQKAQQLMQERQQRRQERMKQHTQSTQQAPS
jgi:Spy/CpxP family protein refolding chaperone